MESPTGIAPTDLAAALAVAERAAREAGAFIRGHAGDAKSVDSFTTHDIKLELDVRSQELITPLLLGGLPGSAVLGEEGSAGDPGSEWQWVVDPIDGTVNYYFGIPHYCVSIALRHRGEIVAGAVYDPNLDEMFSATRGGGARLDGRPVRVSGRSAMREAIVTVGFAKSKASLDAGFARFQRVAYEVRKTRMLGSAALALAYIACGRLDAYIEEEISLWDIAAGWLLVEEAGGKIELRPSVGGAEKLFICASNGALPLAEFL
jgi:myo-inositol-1(or 4)-monophosphatase